MTADLLPQTYTLLEASKLLGPSYKTLKRRADETGEIAPGVPVLDFGPRCKRVSRVQVERLLSGEAS
jgi:hypothetical protein